MGIQIKDEWVTPPYDTTFQLYPGTKNDVCMTTEDFKKVIINQATCTKIKDEMLLTIKAANGEVP